MLHDLIDIFNLRTLALALLFLLPLEKLIPLHAEQKTLRKGWKNDLVYFFCNGILIKFGLIALFAVTVHFSAKLMPPSVHTAVASQPFLLQLIEVIVISDLCFYGVHRLFHKIPWLWNFHQIHHSIEDLDWLAGVRVHPLDQILTKAGAVVPAFLFGFSPEAVGASYLIYSVQSTLVHSNIRTGGLGPLSWLVASPEYHHWHHNNDPRAYNKNFAGQLPWIDALFGTAYMPRGEKPVRYGIDQKLPDSYIAQLFYPIETTISSAAIRKTDAP